MLPYRRARVQFASALVWITVGLLLAVLRDELTRLVAIPTWAVLLTIFTFVGSGLATLLLLYLRGEIGGSLDDRIWASESPWELRRPRASPVRDDTSEIRTELAQLREEIASFQAKRFDVSPDERQNAIDAIRTDLSNVIVGELERRFLAAGEDEALFLQIRKTIEATYLRLRQEIVALNRRGNVNLVIGSLTTAVAVTILAYMVLTEDVNFNDLPSLLSHYIPRVTTVVFIEVFAFFFLRLYRNTLAEAKFYQNELTTLSVQSLVIEAALQKTSEAGREKILERLASNDRNQSAALPSQQYAPKETSVSLDQVAKIITEIGKRPTGG